MGNCCGSRCGRLWLASGYQQVQTRIDFADYHHNYITTTITLGKSMADVIRMCALLLILLVLLRKCGDGRVSTRSQSVGREPEHRDGTNPVCRPSAVLCRLLATRPMPTCHICLVPLCLHFPFGALEYHASSCMSYRTLFSLDAIV